MTDQTTTQNAWDETAHRIGEFAWNDRSQAAFLGTRIADATAAQRIEQFAQVFRSETRTIMDELGPDHYEAALIALRDPLHDIQDTTSKWAWAGRLPAAERAIEQAARDAAGEF
jgi:hypothetical protein